MTYLAQRLERILQLNPQATAVDHHGEQAVAWGDLARVAHGVQDSLAAAGVGTNEWAAWVARNEPALVGAAIGVLASDRSLSPVNPYQPAARVADEVRALARPAVIAARKDWTPELVEAARSIGAAGIVLDLSADPPAVLHGALQHAAPQPGRPRPEGAVIERVTSGTTGAAKRIPVNEKALVMALAGSAMTKSATENLALLKLQRAHAILFKPFAHSGGLWSMLMAVFHARPIALYDRFTLDNWLHAVRKFRPKVAGLVPAMIKMVLDANVAREDLSSLRAVRAGTAPLDPEVQREFEERYGVPILIDYGASEFIGGVAGWTLEDHKAFSKTKRGSVGRARAGVQLRVCDPETNAVLTTGEIGRLDIKSERFGPDWHRTTDLASVDADGFIFLHGRSDEAINRGGFKVLPEKVAEALRLHPLVHDACVLGVADARLGQVPVAFVEPYAGKPAPAADALEQFLRCSLPPYQVPVAFETVEKLPRTVSLKISRPLLREQFAHRYRFA